MTSNPPPAGFVRLKRPGQPATITPLTPTVPNRSRLHASPLKAVV